MAKHNITGQRGEFAAINYLQKKGYKILETNWRFQRVELDIIATFNNQLIVIEVKTRTSEEFERPEEAVTISKQKRIVKAADAFIQERDVDMECRFDVVSVIMKDEEPSLEHIEDAFYPLL